MKVAVGSKNPTKIGAIENAFKLFFTNVEILSVSVESDVSKQPFDADLRKGAISRAKKAQKMTNADFGVGLEGGILELHGVYYITSHTAIVDKNGECHGAHDMLWECPKKILEEIKNGKEMGDIMDEMIKSKNTKQKKGGIGYFSKGTLPREKAMINGVIGALIPFLNKEHYK